MKKIRTPARPLTPTVRTRPKKLSLFILDTAPSIVYFIQNTLLPLVQILSLLLFCRKTHPAANAKENETSQPHRLEDEKTQKILLCYPFVHRWLC